MGKLKFEPDRSRSSSNYLNFIQINQLNRRHTVGMPGAM